MNQFRHCILAAGPVLLLALLGGCEFLETPTKAHAVPNQDGKYIQFFFGETGDTLNVEAAVVTGGMKRIAKGSAQGFLRGPIGRIALIQVDFKDCGKVSFGQMGSNQNTVVAVQYPYSSISNSTCPIASWSGDWNVIR